MIFPTRLAVPLALIGALAACDANNINEGEPVTLVVDGVTYDGIRRDTPEAAAASYSNYRFGVAGEYVSCDSFADCEKRIRDVLRKKAEEEQVATGIFRADIPPAPKKAEETSLGD